MSTVGKAARLPARFLTLVVAVIVIAAAGTTPLLAQPTGSNQYQLSAGQAVPVGELEAVGTIPGCTASLIGNRLVLTAAHCVCPSQTDANNCSTRATFTMHDVFPVDNPSTAVDESKTRTDVNMAGNVRVHPEYTLRGWMREDYAVVDLDNSITTVAHVTPLQVEAPYNIPFEGDSVTLVGFGATGTNCTGASLGKMKMGVVVTGSGWGGISFKNAKLHACPGDSGGPALNSSKHIVGVASWIGGSDSTYRPTSYAYNWIFGISQPKWTSCSWVPIEQGGKNSHQPTQFCPDGAFLTALDFDGDRSVSGHDAPVIGQARCCNVAGAGSAKWASSSWVPVEKAGLNSHSMDGTWCSMGGFITGIDLDGCPSCSAMDSPVIGQVQCSKLTGSQYAKWGSSYWMDVGGPASHQAGNGWCIDGAFITQLDLDQAGGADVHDSPVVGHAKCSALMPIALGVPGAAEFDTDRGGSNYKVFNLSQAYPALCQAQCYAETQCQAWTYVKPGIQGSSARCWLKNAAPAATLSSCCVSGLK